jgi:hypothetical protein
MKRRARRWPEVRAGLIALAILIGLVDGCPLPNRANTQAWQEPIVAVARPVQNALMRPFAWVREGGRFTQRWALFATAVRDRYRLEVQGQKRDGTWELLYRAGDPAHRAYADDLEDERVRGAWAPTDRPQERYPDFSRWFARRVLADHPEYNVVRTWFERVVLERGVVRGTGTYILHVDTPRGSS